VVIQKRTRQQIRQSVGYNLGAMETGTAYDAGSTTTLISLTLVGSDDNYNGKWLVVADVSNSNNTETRIISDYTASAYRLTLQQVLSFATAAGDTYEIWDRQYNPTAINEFINQAILDVTGQVYDPMESDDLHTDGKTARFDIPSNFSMVNSIQYRSEFTWTSLHQCNAAFDEHSTLVATTLNGAITSTSATSVPVTSATPLRANQQIMVGSEKMTISSISSNTLTVSRGAGGTTAATHSDGASVLLFPVVDTKDNKRDTGSNKFIIPAAAGTNQIVTESISSKDISKYDYLEGWIKSTVGTSSGNLQILLDDTASCASPIESLDIPALTADTWSYFRIQLANPEIDTAIISIGLKQTGTDLGACTIFLDDLKVVHNDSATWTNVPSHLWNIDKVAQDIVFTRDGVQLTGYHLLKLKGGDKPALLTTETATCEIDDGYVINKATALALSATSGGPATDPDAKRQQAAFYFGMSEQNKRAFPFLVNVRTIS